MSLKSGVQGCVNVLDKEPKPMWEKSRLVFPMVAGREGKERENEKKPTISVALTQYLSM
jgi:hypothetical protein